MQCLFQMVPVWGDILILGPPQKKLKKNTLIFKSSNTHFCSSSTSQQFQRWWFSAFRISPNKWAWLPFQRQVRPIVGGQHLTSTRGEEIQYPVVNWLSYFLECIKPCKWWDDILHINRLAGFQPSTVPNFKKKKCCSQTLSDLGQLIIHNAPTRIASFKVGFPSLSHIWSEEKRADLVVKSVAQKKKKR